MSISKGVVYIRYLLPTAMVQQKVGSRVARWYIFKANLGKFLEGLAKEDVQISFGR
jgi:hypothetical protein